MDFGRALSIAFATGNGRKLQEGEVDQTEQVPWIYGLIGIAIVVVAQLALILWPMGVAVDATILRDLAITAFAALAVPFLLFWVGAGITGTVARLPAAFLFLGIALAILQVVSGVLASFGAGQSGFVIGLLLAVHMLAARGFLKLGWPGAILIGVLVVAGFIGANFLLLMVLPSGRLLT
jgi:hypothetical protein